MFSSDAFEGVAVPRGRYMHYFWNAHWLGSGLTWDEFERVYEAARNHGEALYYLNKRGLSEQWRNTERLVSMGVPFAQEFSDWLHQGELRESPPSALLMQCLKELPRTNAEHLPRMMDAISYLVLNRITLRAGEQHYRITDLEFYYRRESGHADPYVHGGPEQRKTGTWFYNMAGGLDLTCGDEHSEGGILLRGLQKLGAAPAYFVSGVQLVLRELVSALGNAVAEGKGWQLVAAEAPTDEPVWRTSREGLVGKDDCVAQDFAARKYRHLSGSGYLGSLKGKEKLLKELVGDKQVKAEDVAALLGYRAKWTATT